MANAAVTTERSTAQSLPFEEVQAAEPVAASEATPHADGGAAGRAAPADSGVDATVEERVSDEVTDAPVGRTAEGFEKRMGAARAWVRDQRAAYPTATPDALARLAERELGRRASLARLVRWHTPAADLVLRIAAAYGRTATEQDIRELARRPRVAARARARFRAK